jgi:hypothetical protein
VTLSAAITGNPPPFEWEWRLGSVPVWTNFSDQRSSFFTLTAPGLPSSVSYRAVVRNAARAYPGVGSSLAVITIVADTDGDGLPDDWETAHGLSPLNPADRDLDSDSDGLSNHEEYVAGTSPTSAASWLKVECEIEPGAGVVHFSAASNKTYTVEFTDDLRTGAWNRLADVVARSTNRVEVIPDPAWRATRFYRLVTPARQ